MKRTATVAIGAYMALCLALATGSVPSLPTAFAADDQTADSQKPEDIPAPTADDFRGWRLTAGEVEGKLLDQVLAALGRDESGQALAGTLRDLAGFYRDKGNNQRGAAIWAWVVRIDDTGDETYQTSSDLRELGLALRELRLYEVSRQAHLRALAIRQRIKGPNDLSVAMSLRDLATSSIDIRPEAEVEQLFLRAIAAFEKVEPRDDPRLGTTANNLAYFYRCRNRFVEAEQWYRKALEIRTRAHGPDDPLTLSTMTNLSRLYEAMGRLADAEKLLRGAMEGARERHGANSLIVASRQRMLASVLDDMGRSDEAKQLLEAALKTIRAKEDGPSFDEAHAVAELAFLNHSRGANEAAARLFLEALEVYKNLGDEGGRSAGRCWIKLSWCQRDLGNMAEAKAAAEKSLAIMRRAYGEKHIETAQAHGAVAGVLKAQGKWQEAEVSYRLAADILRAASVQRGHGAADVNNILGGLADCYSNAGKKDEAEKTWLECLDIINRESGPQSDAAASICNRLALFYMHDVRLDEASRYNLFALAAYTAIGGENDPRVASQLRHQGMIYRRQKKYEAAEKVYKQALAIHDYLKLGPSNSHALTLESYAYLLDEMGRSEASKPYWEAASEMRRQIRKPDGPAVEE